ncbi:MAG: HAD-IIA family hydrolase [Candidatus Atribacteria bacterium]|nr:HAD-IIA family hydrolase [Candidatus Atribacteria bacterium]
MFIDDFELFLFDADGVIYIGDQPCLGAAEVISWLQKRGNGVRILTNDSRFSREEIQEKLSRMNVFLDKEDIITASWCAASYLQKMKASKVLVVGTDALKREITEMGVTLVDDSPEAIVIGFNEDLKLKEIQQAIHYVERGVAFIATNGDISYPTPQGRQPATGSIVRLIENVTGQKAFIIGKPSSFIFQIAQNGYSPETRTIMIGDSPEIDILGAHQVNIPAVLVSTQSIQYPTLRDYRVPDGQVNNLFQLFEESFQLNLWQKPDFPWPEKIEIAVAAFIISKNKQVLLIKRKDNSYWALPTGKVERGETLEEAVVREIKEELNLKIRVKYLVGLYSHPSDQVLSYSSGETIQFVTVCFFCEAKEGDLRNNQSEILESGFYSVSQFPQPMVNSHLRWIEDGLREDRLTIFR